jgi:hypothetical protein
VKTKKKLQEELESYRRIMRLDRQLCIDTGRKLDTVTDEVNAAKQKLAASMGYLRHVYRYKTLDELVSEKIDRDFLGDLFHDDEEHCDYLR